jgi:DNA-binding protein HU-beta
MTKAQLVETIASRSRLTKKSAAELLDIVFENIGDAVKRETRFSYPGFGTWLLRQRKARRVRNPRTNEVMSLNASRTIGFRPAKELKQTL